MKPDCSDMPAGRRARMERRQRLKAGFVGIVCPGLTADPPEDPYGAILGLFLAVVMLCAFLCGAMNTAVGQIAAGH